MPRPSLYGTRLVYVPVRMHPEVLKAAEAAAKKRGVSASQVIHEWCIQASGARVKPQEPKA